MEPEPTNFKNEGSVLKIKWTDEHESIYNHKYLRENCPCALCQGEPDMLGKIKVIGQTISGQTISDDVRPKEISPVGRYAISIIWSDGHRTGIYAFDYLRGLCQCNECLSPETTK